MEVRKKAGKAMDEASENVLASRRPSLWEHDTIYSFRQFPISNVCAIDIVVSHRISNYVNARHHTSSNLCCPAVSGHFIFSPECGSKVILKAIDAVKCRSCGHRILYKARNKDVIEYLAR